MEIRVLKYFLAVTREQNISKAAEVLHLTQPTLSRQLKELEDELGKVLFIRGKRKISLTSDGMLLRKRAEEMVELEEKTLKELSNSAISGEIIIACGELYDNRLIFEIIADMQKFYPTVKIKVNSGDKNDLLDNLDKGLYDFGVFIGEIDKNKYNYIQLPFNIKWGIVALKNSKLALKKVITNKELKSLPLIISRQMIEDFKNEKFKDYNIVATYNLAYNASLMVEVNMGYALTIDKLINTSDSSSLCFIPLENNFTSNVFIVWKKYQLFNKASELFLSKLIEKFNKGIN